MGASMTIGAYLLPQVFGEFHRRHPDIELELEIANTETIQHHLMEGSFDIGLTEGLMDAEHLDSEVFHEDELVAIAPHGHPLLKHKRVTAREFCREPFILREAGSGTRAVVERALGKRDLKVKPVLSLANPEAIKRAVIAGLGVAIVSRLAIACELQIGSLAVVPLKDLVIRRPLHLQQLRSKSPSPAAIQFLKLLYAHKGKGIR